MADEVIEETGTQEPTAENTVEDESKLPSEQEPAWEAPTKDEWEALNTKNEHAETKLKELKDEKSQRVKGEKQAEKSAESEAIKAETLSNVVTEMIDNSMEISSESMEKALEAGLTQEQIELAAYKQKDNISRLYTIAGGKEQFEAAKDVLDGVLTDTQKTNFAKSLGDPALAEFAIKGFMAEAKAVNSGGDNRISVTGSVQSGSVSGYSSMQEYYADKRAADRMNGPSKAKAFGKIDAKLAKSKDLR